MTREEEIKQAYKDYIIKYGFQPNPRLAFNAGAKWADKHPFVACHKVTEELNNKNAELIIDSDGGLRYWSIQELANDAMLMI